MASESLNTLLKSIAEANTKISNRLGLLDTHITAIITAGKALLAKIKAGTLLPDQIAQIRGKLNSLREKTLANVGSKNTRIQELEELFTQLLGASPPNTATPNVGNLGLGNIGNYFSSARNAPKNSVATGEPNRTKLLNYGNVGDLFSSAPEAPKNYKVAKGQNYENAKRANVERQGTRELERLASQQAPIVQAPNMNNNDNGVNGSRDLRNVTLHEINSNSVSSVNGTNSPVANNVNSGNLFEPLNPANTNVETVLAKINAIPDSNIRINNNHLTKIKEAINAVRVFLQVQTEINDGLLQYTDIRYKIKEASSLIGEMRTKHKPVLKYIVSLAGDLAHFTEKIKGSIGIFYKSDIQVRIDILTAVIANLPEENYELKGYLNMLYEERQKQSGGKRNTRCGCGLKGGRRARKATRKRSNSYTTRKRSNS